jgi:hypothetical protein
MAKYPFEPRNRFELRRLLGVEKLLCRTTGSLYAAMLSRTFYETSDKKKVLDTRQSISKR